MELRILLLLALAGCATAPPRHDTGPAPHMVAAPESLAALEGARVLREGGNAADAAVCVGFVLAVTHPQAGNLGGGGFLLIHTRDDDVVIDARETAPAAATAGMYLDRNGDVRPEASLVGPLASGVPGSVAGYEALHRLMGTKSWTRLLAPAIRLAEEGFEVDAGLHASLERSKKLLGRQAETASIFLSKGRVPPVGSTLRQPALAATLRRIAEEGSSGFYTGPVARKIVEICRRDGGIITMEDLKEYRVRIREPVRGTFSGYEVLTMPPPSSGGVVMLEMLGMLDELGFMSGFPDLWLHAFAECGRRAFADRAAYFGDPDFVEVPVEQLLERDYLLRRARDIDPEKATPSASVRGGLAEESEETCHFSIVDVHGNAVACTTTLNGSFGCGASAAGVLLNNEMDDFTSKPCAPNLYGLIQSARNAIEPGKRPLSSMTPTILLEGNRPALVLGSPGGPTIISTVCQVILNKMLRQMDLQEAVDAPRIHHQWLPDKIFHEPLDAKLAAALRRRGHTLQERRAMGDVQAIASVPGGWVGASDPRGRGRTAW
ncbi:MAG: gamma-glutamyltransferase [Planctomycetota bacterium]|nr:gamma-glutamyltransferase [Planctomycetota bacterium]